MDEEERDQAVFSSCVIFVVHCATVTLVETIPVRAGIGDLLSSVMFFRSKLAWVSIWVESKYNDVKCRLLKRLSVVARGGVAGVAELISHPLQSSRRCSSRPAHFSRQSSW